MSNLYGGAPLTPTPGTQQSPPIQIKTGSQSFFKALLSPFRGASAQPQNASRGTELGVHEHVTAAAPLSDDDCVLRNGQGPMITAPRALYESTTAAYHGSAAVTPVPVLQLQHSFDALPSFLRRSSVASSNHVSGSDNVLGGDAFRLARNHNRASPPPPTETGEGVDNSSLTSTSSSASSSFLKSLSGHHLYTKALAMRPASKRSLAPPTDGHANPSGGYIAPSVQPGLCAPQMLGYRQCLEVNPDMKTNCTWALDSYMQCQEDAQL